MSKVARFLLLTVSLWCTHTHALDVAGFEKLIATANRGIGDEKGLQARLSLTYYFQGISDIIAGAHNKETGEVYYAGPRKICMPRSLVLSSEMLQSMTAQQVRTAERSGAFKDDWKASNLNLFVFLALTSNYPCA